MPKPLDSAQAADLAGISTRAMFGKTASDDPPVKGAEGYPCRPFGQWLKRRHLRGIGVTDQGVKYDLDSERGRLTHHQANIAGLDETDTRRNLIPAELVRRLWAAQAAAAQDRLQTLPARAAARCDRPEVELAARLLVAEVLDELAHDLLDAKARPSA